MAIPHGSVAALLLRAGFLTAALAVIAGIFGMHVMTGTHHTDGGHTLPAAAARSIGHVESAVTSHSSDSHESGNTGAAPTHQTTCFSSCCLAGSCPDISAGGTSCVLSPGNTSLTAPAPGTAPYALQDFGAAANGTNYFYSPAGPSPCDLGISRT